MPWVNRLAAANASAAPAVTGSDEDPSTRPRCMRGIPRSLGPRELGVVLRQAGTQHGRGEPGDHERLRRRVELAADRPGVGSNEPEPGVIVWVPEHDHAGHPRVATGVQPEPDQLATHTAP